MLSTLRNAVKVPELRKRIIFTIFMLAIYRMGNLIPVPGINKVALANMAKQSGGTLFGFYDLMLGGAFSSFSIFAMGVFPYINASIILQLLTIALPPLEQLSKEGEEGRKKIQEYTKYSAVLLALINAYGQYKIIAHYGAIQNTSNFNMFLIIITLTAASTFLVWFGEQITQNGIGNGISVLIFVNIISRFPQVVKQLVVLRKGETVTPVEMIIFLLISIALFMIVIVASLSERRIPVQYAGRMAGNGRMFKGQSTYIPISLTSSAVIGIIFAMSVLGFPKTILQFWPDSPAYKLIINGKYSIFNEGTWQFPVVSFIFIIFFTWFYTIVTLKPDEMAENMNKSSGFIPGIRPGAPTEKYIEKVITKTSILGGIFAGVLSIIPTIFQNFTHFQNIRFGGTSLLIIVGVAIETLRQLESQLVMRHYQGFLK